MSPAEADVIQLLLEMHVISKTDVPDIKAAQSDVLLAVLLDKRVVRPVDAPKVRQAIEEFVSTANQTRRAKAQTELFNLIAKGLDHRIDNACDELREHKERITSRNWPAVALPAAEPEG